LITTQPWANAEVGRIFGMKRGVADRVDRTAQRMEESNCTHLLTVDSDASSAFAADPRFVLEHATEHYSVFRRAGAVSRWATAVAGSARVSVERQLGRMTMALDGAPAGSTTRIAVAESYHPFWRVSGAPGASIVERSDGLLEVGPVPASVRTLTLSFEPPAWPAAISWVAGAAILLLVLAGLARARALEDMGLWAPLGEWLALED
jgi:hypothetical protein